MSTRLDVTGQRPRQSLTSKRIARSVAARKGAATRRARAQGKDPARVWAQLRSRAEKAARVTVRQREQRERAIARERPPAGGGVIEAPPAPDVGGVGGGIGGGGIDRSGPPIEDYDDFGYFVEDDRGWAADEETEYP